MNKLEQRLTDLTKRLATARKSGDVEVIESIEDEIDEVEYELERVFNNQYSSDDEY